MLPGKYTVTLAKRVNGVVTPLPGSADIRSGGARALHTTEDRIAWCDFEDKLQQIAEGANGHSGCGDGAATRLDAIRRAIDATPSLPPKLHEQALALEKRLDEINLALRGDTIWRAHNEGTPASISEHVQAAGIAHARHHRASHQDGDRAVSDRVR